MQKISIDTSKLSTQFHKDTDSNRVETGALQFNEDWPGIFVRGDNAFHYNMHLKAALNAAEKGLDLDFITKSVLKSLVDLFDSCVVISHDDDNMGVGS